MLPLSEAALTLLGTLGLPHKASLAIFLKGPTAWPHAGHLGRLLPSPCHLLLLLLLLLPTPLLFLVLHGVASGPHLWEPSTFPTQRTLVHWLGSYSLLLQPDICKVICS